MRSKVAPYAAHVAGLCIITYLSGLGFYLSPFIALLCTALFWITMRRGDEAAAELDGMDRTQGREYDAKEITLNYAIPFAGIALTSGAIYGYAGYPLYITMSVTVLCLLVLPAWAVSIYSYKNAGIIGIGGAGNRARIEAITGAACGAALGVLIHSVGVVCA